MDDRGSRLYAEWVSLRVMRVTLQATDGDERGDTSIEHLESRKQASCKVHLVAAIGIETKNGY